MEELPPFDDEDFTSEEHLELAREYASLAQEHAEKALKNAPWYVTAVYHVSYHAYPLVAFVFGIVVHRAWVIFVLGL